MRRATNRKLCPIGEAENGLLEALRNSTSFLALGSERDRTVRATFMRALIGGEVEKIRISDRGIVAQGVIFKEPLDLSCMGRAGAPMPPLWLPGCEFRRGVSLSASHWQSLFLADAVVGSERDEADLTCDWMEIVHQISAEGMTVWGSARMGGITVGADIGLAGSKIREVHLDRAKIGGSLFCASDGRKPLETSFVDLESTQLEGDVYMAGVCITGKDGFALNASGMRARSFDASEQDGARFCATGTVALDRAEIARYVALAGARLEAAEGNALSGGGLKAGNLFARATEGKLPFEAHGSVNLALADIAGHCDFGGATILAEESEHALALFHARLGSLYLGSRSKGAMTLVGNIAVNNARINNALVVRFARESRGKIDLANAEADTVFRFNPSAWGEKPTRDEGQAKGVLLELEGFTYDSVHEEADEEPITESCPPRGMLRKTLVRYWSRLSGRPQPGSAEANLLDWLERQYPDNKPSRRHFRPASYGQAASYLRKIGNARAAKAIATARQRHQQACRVDNRFDSFWRTLYGIFFDFGYSPARASIWAALLFGAGWLSVWAMQSANVLIDRGHEERVEAAMLIAEAAAPTRPKGQDRVIKVSPVTLPLRSIPCEVSSFAYAADGFIPFADLDAESECKFATSDPGRKLPASLWHFAWIFYKVVCLIFVPLLTLTYSGVLRKE